MSFGEPLKPKEQLALTAFLLGFEAGEIELGNRNVDRQVTDALGTHAPGGPVSDVWLDSAMTKIGATNYFDLAKKTKALSKVGGLTFKPKTSNREELRKTLTARAEIEQTGQASPPGNFEARLARDDKLKEF